MTLPPLDSLAPYLSGVAAILGLATLTFVLKLTATINSVEERRTRLEEKRTQVVLERQKLSEERREFETSQLGKENEDLRAQLEAVLDEGGMSFEALSAGRAFTEARADLLAAVDQLLSKMEAADAMTGRIVDPDWHLEMARGFMAKREWAKAADHFDEYILTDPRDSDIHFVRGVAHANRRGGTPGNLTALRAYNEAVALSPPDLDPKVKARFVNYRGAMLKRLTRFDEAEADLKLALALSTHPTIEADVLYNLACVYAMQGDREQMLEMVRRLEPYARERGRITYHLDDYFVDFRDDPELRQLVSGEAT